MNTPPPEEPVVTVGDTSTEQRTADTEPPKRSTLKRLFGIDLWGAVKLLAVCILVGFFLLALEFDPASQDVDVLSALAKTLGNLIEAVWWGILNFWQPLLAGASIVLPLWILWRLISFPFRK